MTMLILVAAGLDKPSAAVTVAVAVIATGTAIASWGELAFNMLGFLFMILSEFCEACKLAAMQFLLGNLKLSLMEARPESDAVSRTLCMC
jgi:drug/metabolite transporter (DMT)-like permease